MSATYNITTYQGDNFALSFTVTGDYSTYLHTMTISTTVNGAAVTLALTSPTEITRTYSAVTGLTTCVASMTPAQSSALGGLLYFYDYEVSLLPFTCLTLLNGTFSVTQEVTH